AADSLGDRRDAAARAAVRRAEPGRAPRHAHSPRSGAEHPGLSLVIFTPRDDVAVHAPDPLTAEPLLASGTPHLYAGVVEGTGVVGPLVLPGETGCAGCLDRDRTDRDPVWPRLVTQWRSGRGPRVGACDLALATAVAGLAAAHALAFLDGESPSVAGARWEVSLPRLNWHTRPVRPHPACGCGAARRDKREDSSTDGEPRATMAVQRPSTERRREAGAARPAGTWRAHV
ncbi:TOMM precursor leader peptide-binding protein, partial [Streptomyces rameus]|uniref:TOMM precursor leader peptide-binding protein n=1 Tax=Streptomyces rameus TaxID=68261 RepID=UPI0031E7793E